MLPRRAVAGGFVALVAALAAVVIGGAWFMRQLDPDAPLPPFTRLQSLAAFSEYGVHVEIALERDLRGRLVLAGTYTPPEADMHFYGVDLPRAGIAGLGRPTRLDVPASLVAGRITADRPVVLDEIAELGVVLPIYPDGPVTLRVPVTLPPGERPAEATLRISYMACSSKGYCLPPVVDREVTVLLPRAAP
jgi:hypothetical protein